MAKDVFRPLLTRGYIPCMTLRDWLAGQAIDAATHGFPPHGFKDVRWWEITNADDIAGRAYAIADAMLRHGEGGAT